MFRRLSLLLLLPALAACPSGSGGDAANEMTREQRDSMIGESALPGAQGVRGALDAVDAAGARAEAHDTIR